MILQYAKTIITQMIDKNTVAKQSTSETSYQYTVFNTKNPALITIDVDQKSGIYKIFTDNKSTLLYRYEWKNVNPANTEYKTFMEIIKCCDKKIAHQEQHPRKTMAEQVESFMPAQRGKLYPMLMRTVQK